MEQVKTKITEISEKEVSHKEHAGELHATCPYCSSENIYGISRVVGYFSVIENWNKSKKSELKRRQNGNYWSKEI